MPTSLYNFQYVPLTGRLPGKSFVSQTEQAINGLARYVYDNSTNYEAVKAIAQKAEEDSSSALEYSKEALDKAQTALETVGRAYIKTTSAVDLDDYYDSELLLILSEESTNLPANISGYLTVMSSDTHDYCMQIYIGIDGSVYKRTATISNDVPTFGPWSETPITLSSLQPILANYTTVDASNIGVNAESDNSTAWGNAIGGGEIVSREQRLVTGDTVYESEYQLEQKVETDIGTNDKRISNIEKLLQGNLYDYQTDSTSAYTKSVPSGALPYAGLEKVGGKTVVMNQLYRIQNSTLTQNGVTVTSDGTAHTITLTDSCTETATIWLDIRKPNDGTVYADADKLTAGHKYATILNGSNIPMLRHTYDAVPRNTSFILTANGSYGYVLGVNVTAGQTYNATFKVMLIDLTLMFGAGNEPTIEQFEAMFPSDWYDATYGTLLSAGVTEVVSKDANNSTLQTYSIPAEVQALEGYGWSAGTAYNYVDFERKVFVKNVGKIVLDGTQSIYIANWQPTDNGVGWIYPYNATNNKIVDYGIMPNITSTKYTANRYESLQGHEVGISVYYLNTLGLVIWQNDTSLNTATAINNYLSANPITVYYELATPVEVDISAYLTDDNLIQVESGGTLTFENQHGDDYQIPVPSDETYMIDLQEAINNG